MVGERLMAKRGERELRTAVRRLLNSVQPRLPTAHGLLGDGHGNVDIPTRPGYVHVRLYGDDSQLEQVFAKRWSATEGTPVIVGELPQQPGFRQLIDIDWGTWLNQGGYSYTGTAYLQQHGWTHEWDRGDTTYIAAEQFAPMGLGPTSPATWEAFVRPGIYPYGTSYKHWPGGFTDDLETLVPTVPGFRYIGLYINPVTNTLHGVTGSVVPPDYYPWYDYIPTLPTGTIIPIGVIELGWGNTTLGTQNIHDLRGFVQPLGGTLTPGPHASTHQNGGTDEVSVGGLSGLLADKQDAGWLQSKAISTNAPAHNDVLTYHTGTAQWTPTPGLPTGTWVWETVYFTMTGNLSTGVQGLRTYVPGTYIIDSVLASVGTPPETQEVIVDVNKNGVTIFTNQANRPTVITGTYYDAGTPDIVDLEAGDYLTYDVDQVGVGVTGADLTVHVRCKQGVKT